MNFDLFETALKNYEKIEESKKTKHKSETKSETKSDSTVCDHKHVILKNGTETCTTCGELLKTKIMHDKEWRCYSNSGKKDPNRVQIRKVDDRNIFKDVQGLGFSNKIVSLANDLYSDVSKGKIYRGNCRRAIIFACIFHAYKSLGHPQTHEKLIKLFKLNRKAGLKGLKHVTLNSNSPLLKGANITPKHLISDTMNIFSASDEQKLEVLELYDRVKNRSSNLNRARPNSIASAIIYYWITKKNINITLKEFAKKTNLSEITISKISKEIATILNKHKMKA
jgi:transcription initiation factor TFIIIB Brf1 subunit/transcription initiation factor TFIIB